MIGGRGLNGVAQDLEFLVEAPDEQLLLGNQELKVLNILGHWRYYCVICIG